jgi:hypothetical protein
MKKLFTNSAMALIVFSFVATSCEKENPAPPAGVAQTKTTWTPAGTTNSKTTDGDVEEGERGTVYLIEPQLPICDCKGKWTHTVQRLNNNAYSSTIDPKTGAVHFSSQLSGTYKITILFSCPDGTAFAAIVSITIK